MRCNTTKSGEMNWTRTTTDGLSVDVYINGHFVDRNQSRYSVVEDGLSIYNARIKDSGRWDCYDGDVRRSGYVLNVTGKKTVNNIQQVLR